MSSRALVLAGLVWSLVAPSPAGAQQDIEESRRRIQAIRAERDSLERQQRRLQGQLSDVGNELQNIERQRDVTNRLVNEIDRQLNGLGSQLDSTSTDLQITQDNLAERRAILERRLVDIYKRGRLYLVQVLLAAESFSDLLTRYKYLALTSRQDRELLSGIEDLAGRVQRQRRGLLEVRDQLDRTREEREAELRRYRSLAQQRTRRLASLRADARSATQRISQLTKDEARLNDLLATLERNRRNAPASRPLPPGTGLTTEDIGRLDWPVQGKIVFQFGRQSLPGGGTIRRSGIGIGARVGTPVKSVAGGRVAIVQPLNTYGLTIILEHGNGYLSLYMQLATATVKPGDQVQKGQVIGTVGGENTDEGPHLQFEIRGPDQIALDPTDWLRRRR